MRWPVPRRSAGLFLDDGAVHLAVVTRSELTHVRLAPEQTLEAGLRNELDQRRLALRAARVGLRRSRVVVKALDLPAASMRTDLGEMVGFELERHVPFAAEEMAWSWAPLPSPRGAAISVLAAACEKRVLDQALRLLEDARLKPRSATVASHDLRALLARDARPARALWVHRTGDTADILALADRRLQLSRSVNAADPAALAAEVASTGGLLRWTEGQVVWVSGDEAARFIEAPELAVRGARPTPPPWSRRAAALLAALPPDGAGAGALAIAVALGSRRPELDLLPVALRPRTLSAGQVLAAGAAALAMLLAGGLFWAEARRDEKYLARLSEAVRALDAEVRAVEGLQGEIDQRKRLLAAIDTAERGALLPLAFLRELTEALPEDAWVSALSADTKGVEITGQAGAANQLIPLLEDSQWLDRVQFTSPVTRGRDKEQFRLKAAWEAGPRGPAVATSAATPPAVPRAGGAQGPTRPTAPVAPPPARQATPPEGPPGLTAPESPPRLVPPESRRQRLRPPGMLPFDRPGRPMRLPATPPAAPPSTTTPPGEDPSPGSPAPEQGG